MDDPIVYLGMDLGTFKTSIAASNGARDVLYSAVGWPKDHVARTTLGRDVVFGAEILQQRLALNVVRPFAKGALKYGRHTEAGLSDEQLERHRQAARLLVQHAVSLAKPRETALVYGVIGAPSRASAANKQFLLEAAQGSFDAVVIVPEPFTVAYGAGQLTNTLVVDIGAGTIDICPMFGAYPSEEEQLTIPIGGDQVDETFLKLVKSAHPEAQLSENMARQIKEKYGFVCDTGERAVVALPVGGRPQPFDLTDLLKQACQTLADPIIEGIGRLIGRCDPEFQQPLLQNILLSGGGSQLKGLDRLVEESLASFGGGSATRVYDCVYAGAAGALKLAIDMPPQQWARIRELDRRPQSEERRAAHAQERSAVKQAA